MNNTFERFKMPWALLKKALYRTLKGKVCPVISGPLRGFSFEMSEACGLAALVSGGSSSEGDTQRQLARHCRPESTVVDCGANWGLHTFLLSRLVGPKGKVLAVEASPEIQKLLKRNIAINKIQNVEVVEKALAQVPGIIRFNSGVGSTTGRCARKDESVDVIEVASTTLDEITKSQPLPVSLVKMDIEGAESMALKGATATLKIIRPVFVIELHSPENDLAVAKIMQQNEYGLYRLNGKKIAKPDCSWPDPEGVYGTIVCIPKEEKDNHSF